ncbi:putative cyclic nucleotide binding domain protein, partial [Vibrio parahaemolyticus EKP-028]
MKISPYPTGRFKNYLEQKSAAFRDLIYQCQVNTRYFDAGEA